MKLSFTKDILKLENNKKILERKSKMRKYKGYVKGD